MFARVQVMVLWHAAQLSVDKIWFAPLPGNNVLLWHVTHVAEVCK